MLNPASFLDAWCMWQLTVNGGFKKQCFVGFIVIAIIIIIIITIIISSSSSSTSSSIGNSALTDSVNFEGVTWINLYATRFMVYFLKIHQA